MDRYRDMCKDLDKDIKQAAQRIKDNLLLDRSDEDRRKKKEEHAPVGKREKRNLLENSDPFNDGLDGKNEVNKKIGGHQPVEKYETNLEASANLVSSNYSNKFEFNFQESEFRESGATGNGKSPQMPSASGKDHALHVNHL